LDGVRGLQSRGKCLFSCTYRPVPGFQPFPPTKLPVFCHWTE
jgi:hypothetical protein